MLLECSCLSHHRRLAHVAVSPAPLITSSHLHRHSSIKRCHYHCHDTLWLVAIIYSTPIPITLHSPRFCHVRRHWGLTSSVSEAGPCGRWCLTEALALAPSRQSLGSPLLSSSSSPTCPPCLVAAFFRAFITRMLHFKLNHWA